MFWKSSLLLAAAGLQAISVSALPTLTSRDDTQCTPGTNFYVCSLNNFRGCCSVDPCALTTGCPDNQPNECGKPGKNRIYDPGMRIVGLDGPQENNFNVSRAGDDVQEQTMYFSIPPTASDCTLYWGVPRAADRVFTVEGSGLVDVFEVDGEGNVGEDIGGADFRFWDDNEEAHDHRSADIDCTPYPTFRIRPVADGEIYIDQNDHTGWYIEYTC
ncbi:hypothetical protein FQN54_001497 [Arachnomyces sp. PD_36]|nr:hypothetical protein FQN54_001497 [Arachnomyces sp. PD_36]